MIITIIIKRIISVVVLLVTLAKDLKIEDETLTAVEILVEIRIIVEGAEVVMIFVETGKFRL